MLTQHRPRSIADRASAYLRTRTPVGRSVGKVVDALRPRRVPLHWTNLFGVVALACVAVLFVTGAILMIFYAPSSERVVYHGGYAPLVGQEVSRAYASMLAISFDVPGGLLLRQLHHWAGLLLPAAVIMQLVVTFFTGAFRRPRRFAWVLLFLVLIASLAGGWSGYALPDDMLSGTGLRIVQGIVLGIPVVGTWATTLLFGSGFPGAIIENLYVVHVVLVPAALVALLVARARAAYRTRPPQFAGPGRTEDNVVGVPLLTGGLARASGLFAAVVGLLLLIAATVRVAPIWVYGPSDPGNATAGSQPDWYTGFLDGALRLVPPGWEFEWLNTTWTLAVLVPLAVVGAFLLLVMVYPYLEEWITRDRRDHHILDRPRNAATRTGIGVAGIVFYGVLWGAASADVAATALHLSIESLIVVLQLALLAGPLLAFELTRRICIGLQRKDRERLLHGFETGRIVRLPGGEYAELHAPLDRYERWRIAAYEPAPVEPARPDADGRMRVTDRLRERVARWYLGPQAGGPAEAELTESADQSSPRSSGSSSGSLSI